MNVQPYAIDQRLVLASGEIQNYLVIKLANGKETRAPIDLETVKELLEGSGMSPPEPKDPPRQRHFEEGMEVPEQKMAAQDPGAQQIDWTQLPEDTLPEIMKAALRQLSVPKVIPLGVLTATVEQINERFTEEDWRQVAATITPPKPVATTGLRPAEQAERPSSPAPPPAGPAPAPPIGAVQWSDGRPVVPSAMNPGRTVQKDEKGYPIPQDGEVDPGEIVGGPDADEDGVGQL